MNMVNRLICWLRGHEWRPYEVSRYECGMVCLRCGQDTRPSCRRGGAS